MVILFGDFVKKDICVHLAMTSDGNDRQEVSPCCCCLRSHFSDSQCGLSRKQAFKMSSSVNFLVLPTSLTDSVI